MTMSEKRTSNRKGNIENFRVDTKAIGPEEIKAEYKALTDLQYLDPLLEKLSKLMTTRDAKVEVFWSNIYGKKNYTDTFRIVDITTNDMGNKVYIWIMPEGPK
jgi:IMP cyclohydrolase